MHFCFPLNVDPDILLVNPARAEDKAYSEERVVRLADLNLNDSDGIETLYRRIEHAANTVCGWAGPVAPDRRHIGGLPVWRVLRPDWRLAAFRRKKDVA
jgi:hypothetical protein